MTSQLLYDVMLNKEENWQKSCGQEYEYTHKISLIINRREATAMKTFLGFV